MKESRVAEVWVRSSYSGAGTGNNCIEVQCTGSPILIRDSKLPDSPVFTLPPSSFAQLTTSLKHR